MAALFLALSLLPPEGGRYEKVAFPASSFRANARNLFRSRSGKAVREAVNGKHRASCDLGVRRLMQTALRRKTETGNEKDPSAALGMTKRERYISHSFSIRYGSPISRALPPSCGRRCPEGAEVSFRSGWKRKGKRRFLFSSSCHTKPPISIVSESHGLIAGHANQKGAVKK